MVIFIILYLEFMKNDTTADTVFDFEKQIALELVLVQRSKESTKWVIQVLRIS